MGDVRNLKRRRKLKDIQKGRSVKQQLIISLAQLKFSNTKVDEMADAESPLLETEPGKTLGCQQNFKTLFEKWLGSSFF